MAMKKKQQKQPKPIIVAIVFPSHDMLHADFAMALAGICATNIPGVRILLCNPRTSIIQKSRYQATRDCLAKGADAILFLDSDMWFPHTTLLQLLSHHKKVVGASYVTRSEPCKQLGLGNGHRRVIITDSSAGLHQMEMLPTGCLLVHRSVFESIPSPWWHIEWSDEHNDYWGEDYSFCRELMKREIPVYCDVSLSKELKHFGIKAFTYKDCCNEP